MNLTKATKTTVLSSINAVGELALTAETGARVLRKSVEAWEEQSNMERELRTTVFNELKGELATAMKPKLAEELLENMDISSDKINELVTKLTK